MRQKIQMLQLLGVASLCLFGLTGCGLKGPLYLPGPATNTAPPKAKATVPATDAKAGDDNKQESSQ